MGAGEDSPLLKSKLNGDTEIVTLDMRPDTNPQIVHDIREPLPEEHRGAFDLVYAIHVLEHMTRGDALKAAFNMRDALKDGGELHIQTPSLEWVAGEINQYENTPPVLLQILFGLNEPEEQHHRWAFKLIDLRLLVQALGMIPRRFNQGVFEVIDMEGNRYKAVQNEAIALRHIEFEKEYESHVLDPEAALQ